LAQEQPEEAGGFVFFGGRPTAEELPPVAEDALVPLDAADVVPPPLLPPLLLAAQLGQAAASLAPSSEPQPVARS
jgi:hypothetical protein